MWDQKLPYSWMCPCLWRAKMGKKIRPIARLQPERPNLELRNEPPLDSQETPLPNPFMASLWIRSEGIITIAGGAPGGLPRSYSVTSLWHHFDIISATCRAPSMNFCRHTPCIKGYKDDRSRLSSGGSLRSSQLLHFRSSLVIKRIFFAHFNLTWNVMQCFDANVPDFSLLEKCKVEQPRTLAKIH